MHHSQFVQGFQSPEDTPENALQLSFSRNRFYFYETVVKIASQFFGNNKKLVIMIETVNQVEKDVSIDSRVSLQVQQYLVFMKRLIHEVLLVFYYFGDTFSVIKKTTVVDQ